MDWVTVVLVIFAFAFGWVWGRREFRESFRARIEDDQSVIDGLKAQLAEASRESPPSN